MLNFAQFYAEATYFDLVISASYKSDRSISLVTNADGCVLSCARP